MALKFVRSPQETHPDTAKLFVPSAPVGSVAVAPPPAFDAPKSHRKVLKLAGLIAAFALIGAGLLVGGFFVGQSTRQSDAAVEQRLADQATRDHQQASAALSAQAAHLKKQARQAADAARSAGYSSGQSVGYQSGVNDGTSQGFSQGYDEGNFDGYGQGFDEGTCYDPITYAYVC